jgi:ribonuclease HI
MLRGWPLKTVANTPTFGVKCGGFDRPKMRWGFVAARWDELLEEFEGENWQVYAKDRSYWVQNKFRLALKSFAKLAKKPVAVSDACIPLAHISRRIQGDLGGHSLWKIDTPLSLQCDNLQIVNQTSGKWEVQQCGLHGVVDRIRWLSHILESSWKVPKWLGTDCYVNHRKREWNMHADALANKAIDESLTGVWFQDGFRERASCAGCRIFMSMDGACRGNPGKGSYAVCLWTVSNEGVHFCACACGIRDNTTNVQMEAEAVLLAFRVFIEFTTLCR